MSQPLRFMWASSAYGASGFAYVPNPYKPTQSGRSLRDRYPDAIDAEARDTPPELTPYEDDER